MEIYDIPVLNNVRLAFLSVLTGGFDLDHAAFLTARELFEILSNTHQRTEARRLYKNPDLKAADFGFDEPLLHI